MKLAARFRSVSRPARVVPFASAALLVAIMVPTSASATDATVSAARTAWFWSSNQKVTTCTDDGTQNACGNVSIAGGAFGNSTGASPITQGHIGIGVKDGTSDMRAYVKYDLGDIPFGATVGSMVVRFTISKPDQEHAGQHAGATGAKVPGTFNESQALIQVCAVAEPWGAAEGEPPSSTTVVRPKPDKPGGNTQPETSVQRAEPNPDCSVSTPAVFSADGKTLSANVTKIAAQWASGERINEGIALLPVVQGTKPNWTVELHGAATTASSDTGPITFVTEQEATTAAVAFSPPVDPPPPPPPPVIDDGPRFPSFGNPIPIDPGPGPAAPVDFGTGNAPPVAAPPSFVPVGETTGDTPAWFFGLFPLGLLVMGFVSGLIGADTVAASAAGAESRVAAVLRARRLDA